MMILKLKGFSVSFCQQQHSIPMVVSCMLGNLQQDLTLQFLVVIDAYARCAKVIHMYSPTAVDKAVAVLWKLFFLMIYLRK